MASHAVAAGQVQGQAAWVSGRPVPGRMRFSHLHQHIPGISQRMLTLTLRTLERDGLVSRTVYAEVPPRVEYALTLKGRA